MSKTKQTRKLDVKKQTLRTIGGGDLDRAGGGAADHLDTRGRGTIGGGKDTTTVAA